MPRKGEGWLRRKKYAEGEVWLFCFNVPRPGSRPAEHTKVIGLAKDFPKKRDAEREAQRLGYWKLVHPTLGSLTWLSLNKRERCFGRDHDRISRFLISSILFWQSLRSASASASFIEPASILPITTERLA